MIGLIWVLGVIIIFMIIVLKDDPVFSFSRYSELIWSAQGVAQIALVLAAIYAAGHMLVKYW